jgi:hypothetical protein
MGAIAIGTLIWIILGLIVGYKVLQHVKKESQPGREWENQK